MGGDIIILNRKERSALVPHARIIAAHFGSICGMSVDLIRTVTVGSDGRICVWLFDEDVLLDSDGALSMSRVPQRPVFEQHASELFIRDIAMSTKTRNRTKGAFPRAREGGIPLRAVCWLGDGGMVVGSAGGDVMRVDVRGIGKAETAEGGRMSLLQSGHCLEVRLIWFIDILLLARLKPAN